MKTWYKVSFIALIIGWFPFMFLAAGGLHFSVEGRLIIVGIGFIICATSAMSFNMLSRDKGFWIKNEELNKLIKDYKIGVKAYEEARDKLVIKTLKEKQ